MNDPHIRRSSRPFTDSYESATPDEPPRRPTREPRFEPPPELPTPSIAADSTPSEFTAESALEAASDAAYEAGYETAAEAAYETAAEPFADFAEQTLAGRSHIPADLKARGMAPTVLADEAAPLRPRKKLRHQRRSPLRPMVRPALILATICAIPAVLFLWAVNSPQFAVSQLTVEIFDENGVRKAEGAGPERISAKWVHQALRPAIGHNLLRLPLRWAQARLAEHPWIHSVALRKELPGRLHLRIVQKEAVALYRDPARATSENLAYVDARGEIIEPYRLTDGGVDLVMISAPTGVSLRGAVDLLGEIRATRPSWESGLAEIEVLGAEDELQVDSSGLPFPLLLRRGTLARRAPVLDAILPQIASRYPHISSVDLRYSRRIIVQPAEAPRRALRATNG